MKKLISVLYFIQRIFSFFKALSFYLISSFFKSLRHLIKTLFSNGLIILTVTLGFYVMIGYSQFIHATPGQQMFNSLLALRSNVVACDPSVAVTLSTPIFNEYDENTSNIPYTLTLSAPAVCNVTVYLNLTGTAVSVQDYLGLSTAVTIPLGTTVYNGTFNLPDNVVFGDKILNVTLGGSNRNSVYISGNYQQQFFIKDNDSAAYVNPPILYSQISTGQERACGIMSGTGELRCWGKNTNGQIGDGSTSNRTNPVSVDLSVNYSQTSLGSSHSCGIVSSTGVLKCWGLNTNGQIGDATIVQKLAPVVINSGTSYSQVDTGTSHSCGIVVSTGVLKCWGLNSDGRLGDGSTTQRTSPVVINTGVSYSQVSAGAAHSCGIVTSTGVLKCWGNNASGQLGDGSTTNRLSPVVIDSGVSYSQVSAGTDHTCGIVSSTGVLKCWGSNLYVQLGDGTALDRLSPMVIDTGVSYSQVSAGTDHTCGIVSGTGVLKCWGTNSFGQLGDGTSTQRNSPVVIDSGVNFSEVSASYYSTCARVVTSNLLKCWGLNSFSQLGDGLTANLFNPTIINHFYDRLQISAGYAHSCGITLSGVLKCWGDNLNSQLGDGTTTDRLSPIVIDSGVIYSQVSTGTTHSCGIVSSTGVLKCWGDNTYGQLGDASTTDRVSPVVINSGVIYSEVSSGTSHTCGIVSGTRVLKCWGLNTNGRLGDGSVTNRTSPVVIDSGTSYSQVSAGGSHTCGIVSSTGVLKCWGLNTNGQLGDGTVTQRTSPVVIDTGVSYSQVQTGNTHSCGIVSGTGVLKCWGTNSGNQLGDGTTTQRTSPVVIDTGVSYSQVQTGDNHTCGIVTSTGVLKCWGSNYNGQCGNGSSGNYLSTPVVGDSGVSYSQISAGGSYTCGIVLGTRVLKCWGINRAGALGDASTSNRKRPVLINSGVSFDKLGLGFNHSCAIVSSTGVVKCWGANNGGQLGDRTGTARQAPEVIDSGVSYSQISGGEYHTCAIVSGTGVLKCWGYNNVGQLGDGTLSFRLSATVIDSGVTYSQVATGQSHSCGIVSGTGVLKCWGANTYGQLGDGTTVNRAVSAVIDSGVSYSKVSAGDTHTCGIVASTGALKCWGYNWAGQIGDGSNVNRLAPVVVNSGTSYSQISGGSSHSCGIVTTTGVLKCWGVNSYYELGDGTTTARSSPVVINSGTSYSEVKLRYESSCGIVTTTGVLKCWGYNPSSQLGDGSITDRSVPTVIDSGVSYSQVGLGHYHGCGIVSSTGALKCWGDGFSGQLGEGVIARITPQPVIDFSHP